MKENGGHMLAKSYTVSFQGIDVYPVTVEVVITNGLPSFTIVGLADKAVAESRERIRACFHTIGIALPAKRITVNLSPADVPKEGAHFDLPIALGLLGALGIFDLIQLEEYIALGELSLDGKINTCVGILPASLYAVAQQKGIICPVSSGREAAWTGIDRIIAAPDLLTLVNHVKGDQIIAAPKAPNAIAQHTFQVDMKDVRGQLMARRGLEIAAAGGHNVLMSGPPGAGKSMMAQRFPTILPPLTPEESLEVSIIHSISGLLPENGLVTTRPYRDPHHSISTPALVGGGAKAKPGEISLAHHGVLFLDELPEFPRYTLEALRQPLETGEVLIARANNHATFPAKFQLIAAMNPCRCGYLGEAARECVKAPLCGKDYQAKLSGPLLDRFDLFIVMQKIEPKDLVMPDGVTEEIGVTGDTCVGRRSVMNEHSASIRSRVLAAIDTQRARGQTCRNTDLLSNDLLSHLEDSDIMKALLQKAFDRFNLSARGFYRLLKVARTIADLAAHDKVLPDDVLEAMQFRITV